MGLEDEQPHGASLQGKEQPQQLQQNLQGLGSWQLGSVATPVLATDCICVVHCVCAMCWGALAGTVLSPVLWELGNECSFSAHFPQKESTAPEV